MSSSQATRWKSALDQVTQGLQASWSPLLDAERTGTTVRVYYVDGAPIASATSGENGNRFAMYSYATGSASWDATSKIFANGTSPTKWRVSLEFGNLNAYSAPGAASSYPILAAEMADVRKLRWTYAADLQPGEYSRSEFAVAVSNWTVTGSGRAYQIAGPGSRRIEESDALMSYSGTWADLPERGNYSGGMIQKTSEMGASASVTYTMGQPHTLYVGTRYTGNAAKVDVSVDGSAVLTGTDLRIAGEDVLIRLPVAQNAAGAHTVTVTHAGDTGTDLFLDFIEMAVPGSDIPVFPSQPEVTLATDWDTNHSLAIAPERTAWMLDRMGFHGRQNHYVGALVFYELHNPDQQFATGTVTFSGTAEESKLVSVTLDIGGAQTVVQRVMHAGDTVDTVATSFANEFNSGYTSVWASATGGVLTIQSRLLGTEGNGIAVSASTNSTTLGVAASGLSGGADGTWFTDLTASPRLNRAMRDWTTSFFTALVGYGIDAAAAFSTELKDVDPSVTAGIAQRGPGGDAIVLPTPAVQTNFSPTSLAYWKEVHLECAGLMAAAGLQPYLQFGEVQWWYFPHDGLGHNFSGMPFYDGWTQTEFQSQYGRTMAVFTDNNVDPVSYPDETNFLQRVLGDFTDGIMGYVKATYSNARFEVLYPFDVNQTEFNKKINFPAASWTPSTLECLKTEGLSMTFTRRLDQSEDGIDMGDALGFQPNQRAHLVGAGDPTAPWVKEARLATGKRFESVVFFALDQYCLIGLPLPLPALSRRVMRRTCR